jgi:hypothetical protein
MRRRLRKLEEGHQSVHETDEEREQRLMMIREGAEQANKSFFRDLVYRRRRLFLEDLSEASRAELSADELRDENFLYDDDELPFEIMPDGEVYCTRDGKPVTHYRQTLAEVWYWQFREEGYNPRGLIHDDEAQAYYTPDSGEMVFSRDWCILPNYFWSIGDDRAYPQGITHDRKP